MADTAQASDRSLGLGLTFGIIAVLATVLMGVTSYLSFLGDGGNFQLISGLAFAAAILAAVIAVAALHMFAE